MSQPRVAASYGPPQGIPRISLASTLASAILPPREKQEFQDKLHWEFSRKTDQKNKARNKCLEQLKQALKSPSK